MRWRSSAHASSCADTRRWAVLGSKLGAGGGTSGRDRIMFTRRTTLLSSLMLFILLLMGLAMAAAVGARTSREPQRPREDHAVVAVTVDGYVHTLDAWTGKVRGVYVDSGGPLVSSSTTIDADSGEGGSSSTRNGSGGGSGGEHRNALGRGFVVPGLDGVIYSLGSDGQLSVLMSSAPELVLEPRMACLTVSDDSNGIVEDESCGLLIGEKTTELFSLDTETGNAKRVGGSTQSRKNRQNCDSSSSSCSSDGQTRGTDKAGDDEPWRWGQDSQPQQPSQSNLLLQRDEYVVRALDTATSEELWYVTVAHFSALDLEGGGGATALTRAKVAVADREGYTRAIRARSCSSEYDDDFVKALPTPGEDDDLNLGEWDMEENWSSTEPRKSWAEEPKDVLKDRDAGGNDAGSQQSRRRRRFGEEHADRFPYLLYENNAHVVALDPMDGSVLWRKEMSTLAVALYGIRGREWVDIMPPPMSMLQPPPDYYPDTSPFSVLMPQVPFDGEWLDGEDLDESPNRHKPLLIFPDGDTDDSTKETAFVGVGDSSSLTEGISDVYWDGTVTGQCNTDAVSDSDTCDSSKFTDDGDESDSDSDSDSCATTLEDSGTSMVPAIVRSSYADTSTGLVQPGLLQGKLQAQVGFLNGHFFVSSSLRRSPLHAAAEDSAAVVVHDRYPHPFPSRRSLVESARRDVRGGVRDLTTPGTIVSGVSVPLVLPATKVPLRAVRPIDGSEVLKASGGDLASVKDGGFSLDTVSGEGIGGTTMGIGNWKQDILDRVERDMMEERVRVKVEVHPDNKGLFVSWRFVVALAGLVSVIVAGVAYMAYKYGAEAMSNMSTIARKGSSLARINSAGTGGRGGLPTTATDRTGEAHPEVMPLLSTPFPASTPLLKHGVSMSATLNASHSWAVAAGQKDSLEPVIQAEDILQRSRSVQEVSIPRVHSLPVLRQSYSPPAANVRERHDVSRYSLFSSEDVSGRVDKCNSIRSTRGFSSSVDTNALENTDGDSGSADLSHSMSVARDKTDASRHQILKPPKLACKVGSTGAAKGPKNKNFSPTPSPGTAGGSSTPSSISCSSVSVSSSLEEERESPAVVLASSSGTTAMEQPAESSSRQRQQQPRNKPKRESQGHQSRYFSGNDDEPLVEGQKKEKEVAKGDKRLERQKSRSPRPSLGDESGDIVAAGVDVGGDAPDALLVTNRRLRTEFVEGQKLGNGGFGTVYKCRNRLDGHDYAIKKIKLSSDPRWQSQLAKVLREVKIMSLLDHPNIVRYYQVSFWK